jgi:putative MFS transporter
VSEAEQERSTAPGEPGVDAKVPYRRPWRTAPDNPWWIVPPLGRVPDVPPDRIHMLGAVALALFFESYDQAMLTAALKQIAETFAVQESDLGYLLGRVHLGSITAFLLLPFADRIGRRRMFLGSLVGLSLATFFSAFAPGINSFIALQMVSRTFMVTCSATAFVIVSEEFPAAHRGWGIGILGALASLGYGLGLLLFGAIDFLPYGWRALYVVGFAPLLLLPRFRRGVKETRRFHQHRRERGERARSEGWLEAWWSPLRSLMRAHPWRTLAIGAIGSLASAGHAVSFNFSAYFVQAEHGWSPGHYTAMAVVAGGVGIIGHPWAGRMADRRGRRRVGMALLGAYPLLTLAFYHGPSWMLPLVWIPLIFALTGGSTIVRALATELFPTSYRGTSSGWLQLSEAAGRSLGLFLVAWGTPDGGRTTPMIDIVVFAALAAALIVWMLPETGRRELEEISSDADVADADSLGAGLPKPRSSW